MSVYLLLVCLALLQQEGTASPEPPGCSSAEAEKVAEEALEQINKDRTQGYILTLNRLYDLSHTTDKEKGESIYTMTIDVMETKCHISSQKPWKQCEARHLDQVPVYGECVFTASVGSHIQLQSYSCKLREVPATAIVHHCPDCPTAEKLNEPVIVETVNLSLQRFNEESRLANFFTLENITKASLQWVVGPSYFVEFTIVETECSREAGISDASGCRPMECQFAHRGFCSGTHLALEEELEGRRIRIFENPKPVEVKCEIYEPQAVAVEEQTHARANNGHTEHPHHNHTHLHPHEHTHSVTQTSDAAASKPRVSLGSVVDRPASPRPAPSATSCPSPRRHNLGLEGLKL